jgi:SulP family sulfate permease
MKTSILSGLFKDLASPKIIPIISVSVVLGILLIIFAVSFSSMIFSGDMAPLASRAAGLSLAGCFCLCLICAFFGTFNGLIGMVQDAPTAVLSTMAVTVAAALGPASSPDVKFMTLVAVISVSSVCTGVCCIVVGRFGLANLLRYMPYPVVGGFLAGTGWLLSAGSIGVMCDVSLSPTTLGILTEPEILAKWVPGVFYGGALFAVLLKRSHFLIIPGSLLIGASVFYGVLALSGMTIQEAKAAGFLVSGAPEGGLWPAFSLSDLYLIDWPIVLQQLPGAFTVALVTIIGLLLNMSGIELATRSEMDMNRELTVTGAGNLVAGFCGSPPGYPSISLSLLGSKTGADSRLTGVIAALILGGVLFFGGQILEYFPKMILGGLVLLLGLFFIYDWLIITRERLPLLDWLIILAIFGVVGIFGFMEGVAFGLVTSIIFFVFRFSRVPVVKQQFTALERRSLKVRSVPHRHILQTEADKVVGYELTGYLFFGSASTLVESLQNTLSSDSTPQYMILDFSQVTGFDISAINNFQRVVFAAREAGTVIVITAAPERFTRAARMNFSEDTLESIQFFDTLNDGLEWSEDQLIRKIEVGMQGKNDLRDALFDRSVDDVMAHLMRQEYFESLVEALGSRLQRVHHSPGSIIAAKGDAGGGLHLIIWGNAVELDPESGLRVCCFEPGSVIAGPSPFTTEYINPTTVIAEPDCRTAFLSFKARELLENEDPALAIRLYKYLIQANDGKNITFHRLPPGKSA